MAVRRPVIGITAYEDDAAWGPWRAEAVLLPAAYTRAVVAAGGAPVLIPAEPEAASAVLPRLDGLVVAGGPDVDPARYGAAAHPATEPARPERDEAELALLAAAAASGTPVLGVCRGLQLMNVARGGTLLQHLPDVVGHDAHAPAPGGCYGRHEVTVVRGSRLADVMADGPVESCHHQAIDRLGDGLAVSARAPDGTVEAIEDPSLPFHLGIQWHPEEGPDLGLFEALVAASRAG